MVMMNGRVGSSTEMEEQLGKLDAKSRAVLDQLQATVRDIFADNGITEPGDVQLAVQGAMLAMWVMEERAEALEVHGAASHPTVRAVQHLSETMALVLSSIVSD